MLIDWKQIRDTSKTGIELSPHFIRGILGEDKFPVDVEKIITALGIEIIGFPDGEKKLSACKCTEEHAKIWIHEKLSNFRARFAMAHSLGHILLHPTIDHFSNKIFNKSRKDTEALLFAFNLILPGYVWERKIKGSSTYELAVFFGVTQLLIKGRKGLRMKPLCSTDHLVNEGVLLAPDQAS